MYYVEEAYLLLFLRESILFQSTYFAVTASSMNEQ